MKIFLSGLFGIFNLISVSAVETEGEIVINVEEDLKNRKHERGHRKHKYETDDDGYYEDHYFDGYFQDDYGPPGERKSRTHRSRKDQSRHRESKKHRDNKEKEEYQDPPVYYENTHGLSVHKTCKHSGMVALTFDDGVVPETSQILDILSKHGVPATFFTLGMTVDHYPMYRSVLKRILNEGHTLGSHTYSHADLTSLGAEGIKSELNQAGNVFENACGERPKFMRPPYGSVNDEVVRVSKNLGYEIVHWNLDTNDWRNAYDTSPIIDSLYQHDDGSQSSKIVLMHDKPITVQALDSIIKFYTKKGYTFVNMEKCLGMKGYF